MILTCPRNLIRDMYIGIFGTFGLRYMSLTHLFVQRIFLNLVIVTKVCWGRFKFSVASDSVESVSLDVKIL